MKTDRTLLLILVLLHVGLALAYAKVTPFLTPGILFYQKGPDGRPAQVPDVGAPDEMPHVVYVEYVASGKGFPVLRVDDPDLSRNYQSHQPPVFYVLEAAWSTLFKGLLGQQMALRSLNAIIGGITVAGVFALGWWGTRRRELALGGAAFAALLPMNVALSGAVSNDPLLFCTCTWSLAIASLIFTEGPTRVRLIALGVVTGLAFLTKTTSLALIPALGVGWLLAREKVPFKSFAAASGLALLMGALWWVRNQQLYGDPFALGVFTAAFKDSPKASMFIDGLGAFTYWTDWVGWWTARSFIGVFGYMDIFLGDKFYRVALAIIVLLGLLGLLELSKKTESDVESKPVTAMNAVFLVTVIVLFMKFNATYFQGQARYLLPALGPIGLGIGLGLAYIGKSRSLVPIALFALMLVVLNGYILSTLPSEFAKRIGTL